MVETGEQVGERLTSLKDASKLSWSRIARLLQDRIGLYAPTDQTLMTWAKGAVNPETIDPYVVTALADVFECTVADISKNAASNMRRLEHLRQRVDIDLTGEDGSSDRGIKTSGWFPLMGPMAHAVPEIDGLSDDSPKRVMAGVR